MRRVRIVYVLYLYSWMLFLKMVIGYIFEGNWNLIDGAIYSGLWTVTFLVLLWVIEKLSAKRQEPYIIGNSTEIEYLTPEELERRLQNGKGDKNHEL